VNPHSRSFSIVRIRSAFIVAAFALGITPGARAADQPLLGGYFGAPRAEQIVFYDYDEGVVVRPYWLAPWRNVHFFPTNGDTPRIGRRESFRNIPKPVRAENFYRSWSSFPVDTIEQPPLVYAPQTVLPLPARAPQDINPK
jgi:hypothetical protein